MSHPCRNICLCNSIANLLGCVPVLVALLSNIAIRCTDHRTRHDKSVLFRAMQVSWPRSVVCPLAPTNESLARHSMLARRNDLSAPSQRRRRSVKVEPWRGDATGCHLGDVSS